MESLLLQNGYSLAVTCCDGVLINEPINEVEEMVVYTVGAY
jgi:hypothetical protein